jgi:Flp pilus assembly protein TadD
LVSKQLDDAHWADRVSLHWLAYLARRIEGPAALSYLRRAYVELSRASQPPELAIELARALVACGDEAGIEMLRTAHTTAAEPAQRAALALELGRALGATNRVQEAFAVLFHGD